MVAIEGYPSLVMGVEARDLGTIRGKHMRIQVGHSIKASLLRSALTVASFGLAVALSGPADAQSIGDQIQATAQEFSTAGGFAASTAMYVGALICFLGGAWALWKSRQPENRESGNVGMGLAGLVLAGLFVTGGVWINKAAQTASGGAATITSQSGVVNFQ